MKKNSSCNCHGWSFHIPVIYMSMMIMMIIIINKSSSRMIGHDSCLNLPSCFFFAFNYAITLLLDWFFVVVIKLNRFEWNKIHFNGNKMFNVWMSWNSHFSLYRYIEYKCLGQTEKEQKKDSHQNKKKKSPKKLMIMKSIPNFNEKRSIYRFIWFLFSIGINSIKMIDEIWWIIFGQ